MARPLIAPLTTVAALALALHPPAITPMCAGSTAHTAAANASAALMASRGAAAHLRGAASALIAAMTGVVATQQSGGVMASALVGATAMIACSVT